MTLVVVGYRQNGFRWNAKKSEESVPDRRSGIFLIADSLISTETRSGREPLVSGFKKIIEVPINVWQPHFIGELFQGYIKVFQTHKCLIAFAGSTLTAQHIVNSITNHLSELRIDYEKGTEFKCVVRKSCEPNNLVSNGIGTNTNKAIWKEQRLQQTATVKATFANGKSLELDFLVKSEKVEPSVFHSMKKIKTQAELIRNNPIASAKKAREPIKLPKAGSLTVYSPTEKTVIFFSPFREKSYGDTYRYQ